MKDHTLIMTVGRPYSGKSSWAMQMTVKGIPIVSPDAVRLAMHGQRYLAEAERWVWPQVELVVRTMFHTGYPVVILDACMVTRQRRDVWQDKMWERRFKVFDLGQEECIERAKDEEDMEIVTTIIRMSQEWEPLTENEQALILTEDEEMLMLNRGRLT